jgi:hypothetical protein
MSGEQGVVLMAVRKEHPLGQRFALKFFAKLDEYYKEVRVLANVRLQRTGMFPELYAATDNLKKQALAPDADMRIRVALPPYIIVEAGESLKAFRNRVGWRAESDDVDLLATLQVRASACWQAQWLRQRSAAAGTHRQRRKRAAKVDMKHAAPVRHTMPAQNVHRHACAAPANAKTSPRCDADVDGTPDSCLRAPWHRSCSRQVLCFCSASIQLSMSQ